MGAEMMHEEIVYRQLFEHSVQGMVLRQGERIIVVNQSFADMIGYSIDELLEFSFDDALNLIHPEDREPVMARFREFVAKKAAPGTHEYRFIRRNGETGLWSASVSTIDYGGQPAVLGTYVDITERIQARAEIERLARSLSERVKELNCLYGISQLVEEPGTSPERIIHGLLRLKDSSIQNMAMQPL